MHCPFSRCLFLNSRLCTACEYHWRAPRAFACATLNHGFEANSAKSVCPSAIAVGMRITAHPPHRSRRAQLTHRAPTSGNDDQFQILSLLVHQILLGHAYPALRSGTCSAPSVPLGPSPSLHRLRLACANLFADFTATTQRSDFSSSCIIGYGSSPSQCGPHANRSRAKLEISRFPNEMCINMPGSLTTPSRRSTRYNAPQRVAFRRVRIRRHSGLGFFRGGVAGLSTPLSTLHDTPHDAARMTRGQHS
jgi:hypothetical protein